MPADGGCGADHGDQVARAAHLDAEHAEARLLAVEGDALDAAREVFGRRVEYRRRWQQYQSTILTVQRA